MQAPISALEVLWQISQKNKPWPRTAKLASTICMESDAWQQTHNSASDWLADAASRTSHSLNTFRRQLRVVEFLESKLPKDQVEPLLDKDLPFGPLEVLMRLHDFAPHQSMSIFQEVLNGKISYKKMLATYKEAKSAPGVTFRGRRAFAARGQQFEALAIEFIRNHQSELFGGIPTEGKVEFRTNTRGFPFGTADLLAIGKDFIDGYEIKLFGADDTKYVLIRTLEQISLMSTFYRQTWLIYPSADPEQTSHKEFIESLQTHLTSLELTSVGIAQIAEETNPSLRIRLVPKPQQAPRQHLLRKFLR